MRLLDALQDQSANALGRLARRFAGVREAPVGIVFLKASPQLESAGRNLAQSAPLPRSDLEDFSNRLLRGPVPFSPDRAHVLIFDLGASALQVQL